MYCVLLLLSLNVALRKGGGLVELSEIEGFALGILVRNEKTNYFCKAIRMHERRAQSGRPLCAVMFAAEDG